MQVCFSVLKHLVIIPLVPDILNSLSFIHFTACKCAGNDAGALLWAILHLTISGLSISRWFHPWSSC
ncbi:hypothetical protein PAHAL_6G022300 [Panicum hallii]|uniref:Uncharacterized protein n=1 Tax=Panicum hallii TaxID=206008 RepID=A0A2T8IEW2_9POAL|nr:hypothetical protein PAHAL_6G022300 [Panicum hallii]